MCAADGLNDRLRNGLVLAGRLAEARRGQAPQGPIVAEIDRWADDSRKWLAERGITAGENKCSIVE